MTDQNSTRVLVTGASGFIAAHLIQQLLAEGYLVRGTVRSLTNPLKVDPIRKLDEERTRLELVEADLTNVECWKDAVEGCTYVCHTASPFPMGEPRHEDEIIRPAVDGTLNVLRACAGKVKRVVLTSSCAAVGYDETRKFSEEDWLDENRPGLPVYVKSKKLAEKAAWDYVATLEGDEKFELATVQPVYVLGPSLTKASATGIDMICRLMSGKDPALPKVGWQIVDVRDVARGHIAAMTIPEAVGHRHILSSGDWAWLTEITRVLREEFEPQGYKPTTRTLPYFMAVMMSWFDPAIQLIKSSWGLVTDYDNTRMKEVLQITEPVHWKQTVVEMAYSLIESGKIPKKKGYKGRPDKAEPPTSEEGTGEAST